MISQNAKAGMAASAELAREGGAVCKIGVRQRFHVECFDKDGNLKWEEDYDNLVVTAGLNKYLDATLKTGLAVPAWFIGFVAGPGAGNTYAAADTMGSHAGWTESTGYSNATRPAFTPGTISGGSVDNSAAKASYSINASITIAGTFTADSSTKGGTTGTLLGVGNFTGGDRSAVNGDTINVTLTCTMQAV